MRILAAALAGLALLTVACSSDDKATGKPNETAGAFIERQFSYIDKKQWGKQYDDLHPLQQAMIDRTLFIACQSKDLGSLNGVSAKTIETYDEDINVPGTDQHSASTAVTVAVVLTVGKQENKSKETFHVFSVDGRWRWVSSEPKVYDKQRCRT